jgi:hypothetical protein
VRACRVAVAADELDVEGAPVTRSYARVPGFVPVRADARESVPGALELEQARVWIETAVQAVVDVAAGEAVLLGVALPGLKTPDGRGLAWVRHGPRVPDYLSRLAQGLAARGVELRAEPAGLFSDGECAAEGERAAQGGLLRDVREALYLGGGTGLAEACLRGGEVLALDAPQIALPKAWQIVWREGATLEDALSMSGLIARCGGFPEQRLERPEVRAALSAAAVALADLCASRAAAWERAARPPLERVVVGQRLGALLSDPRAGCMRESLAAALGARGLPRSGWLVPSRTPQAGALGAAARARASWEARGG